MEFKFTLYEKAEGIATITINRPEVRNALNNETIAELHARLDDAEKDDIINAEHGALIAFLRPDYQPGWKHFSSSSFC